jgi:ankyrin repeat protein
LAGAVINGRTEIVQSLIRAKVSLNAKDDNGRSALFIAASRGLSEIVELLLAAGAEIESLDTQNRTPLLAACAQGHFAAASRLLEAGAEMNPPGLDHQSALLHACRGGHLEVVGLLLSRGAAVDVADSGGCTPLLAACNRGSLSIVKLLLCAGADPDAGIFLQRSLTDEARDTTDEDTACFPKGTTPLMIAASRRRIGIMSELLRAGAEKEIRDEFCRTALLCAAGVGNIRAVSALINEGASLLRENIDGHRILQIAIDAKAFDLVDYLLELNDDAMQETPSRLLFSSRDIGDMIRHAMRYIEEGVSSRLYEFCEHHAKTKNFQIRHPEGRFI